MAAVEDVTQQLAALMVARTSWKGAQGAPYLNWRTQAERRLAAAQRHVRAGAQPVSTLFSAVAEGLEQGTVAHTATQAVIGALRPLVATALGGREIPLVPLVVPEVEAMLGGAPPVAAPAAAAGPLTDEQLLEDARGWLQEVAPADRADPAMLAHLAEPARTLALIQAPGAVQASGVRLGALQMAALTTALQAAVAAAPAAPPPAPVLPDGWQRLPAVPPAANPTLLDPQSRQWQLWELPVAVLLLTLDRYFGPAAPGEGNRVRALVMQAQEKPSDWAARLATERACLERAAQLGQGVQKLTEQEAVLIYVRGLTQHPAYAALGQTLEGQVHMLPPQQRTLAHVAQLAQRAFASLMEGQDALAQVNAARKAEGVGELPDATSISSSSSSAPAKAAARAAAGGEQEPLVYLRKDGNARSAQMAVNKLDPLALQHLRDAADARLAKQAAGGRRPLAGAAAAVELGSTGAAGLTQPVAQLYAAAAAVAQAGLDPGHLLAAAAGGVGRMQAQAQQQQQQQRQQPPRAAWAPPRGAAGRGALPGRGECGCPGTPMHGSNAYCFLLRPDLAYPNWPRPQRGTPEGNVYERSCRSLGMVPWEESAAAPGIEYPAAACAVLGQPGSSSSGGPSDREAAADGVQWLLGAAAVVAPAQQSAAAAVTRAAGGAPGGSGARGDAAAAGHGEPSQTVLVPITVGRDDDLLADVAAADRESRSPAVPVGATMLSFGGPSLSLAHQLQADSWVVGGLQALVPMQIPRDNAVLRELRNRVAVVARELQERQQQQQLQQSAAQGSSGGLTAAGVSLLAEESTVAARVAAMPAPQRQQWLAWRANKGGRTFFVNASAADGVALCPDDGRVLLWPSVMEDTGSEAFLMDQEAGLNSGLQLQPVEERVTLIPISGERATVTSCFAPLDLVFKRGTADECRMRVSFLAVPGLSKLAQAIIPTEALHSTGALGTDRVTCRFVFRPRIQQGVLDEASVPVRCWAPPQRKVGAALVVAGAGVEPRAAAAASSSSAPRGQPPAVAAVAAAGEGVDTAAVAASSSSAPRGQPPAVAVVAAAREGEATAAVAASSSSTPRGQPPAVAVVAAAGEGEDTAAVAASDSSAPRGQPPVVAVVAAAVEGVDAAAVAASSSSAPLRQAPAVARQAGSGLARGWLRGRGLAAAAASAPRVQQQAAPPRALPREAPGPSLPRAALDLPAPGGEWTEERIMAGPPEVQQLQQQLRRWEEVAAADQIQQALFRQEQLPGLLESAEQADAVRGQLWGLANRRLEALRQTEPRSVTRRWDLPAAEWQVAERLQQAAFDWVATVVGDGAQGGAFGEFWLGLQWELHPTPDWDLGMPADAPSHPLVRLLGRERMEAWRFHALQLGRQEVAAGHPDLLAQTAEQASLRGVAEGPYLGALLEQAVFSLLPGTGHVWHADQLDLCRWLGVPSRLGSSPSTAALGCSCVHLCARWGLAANLPEWGGGADAWLRRWALIWLDAVVPTLGAGARAQAAGADVDHSSGALLEAIHLAHVLQQAVLGPVEAREQQQRALGLEVRSAPPPPHVRAGALLAQHLLRVAAVAPLLVPTSPDEDGSDVWDFGTRAFCAMQQSEALEALSQWALWMAPQPADAWTEVPVGYGLRLRWRSPRTLEGVPAGPPPALPAAAPRRPVRAQRGRWGIVRLLCLLLLFLLAVASPAAAVGVQRHRSRAGVRAQARAQVRGTFRHLQ
jgi:hypothetical protein